jgi:hypothetical protein
MKRQFSMRIFCVGMVLLVASVHVVARQQARPLIVRRVRSETARDGKLDAAIIAALYEGDEGGARRDRVRYYYNRVDLNGDGQPELIVYLFGSTWCGSAGCAALIFQSIKSEYKLVTQISGVENPVIVSRHRTNNWNDLIAHVRWGEVGEHTLRDYYAVLRFDGKTYPDQFPGAPPLGSRVKGIAYLAGSQAPTSGLALRAKVESRSKPF